ncbi:MAG: lamin tail domain-containing protein, partial [Candidatus Woesearchaeota archaeon]
MVNVKIKKKIRRVSAYICLVCLIILAFPFASADLFITQVLYNPLITSTGGEAVEIYNPNDFSVNLAGYTLHTTTRQPDVVFPDNAFIPPRSYFLVADIGWNEKKDSPLYPFADYKQAMTMRMTDGGVAIIDPNQVMVDAVGWGNADGIGLPFYRGVPASYTVRGEALVRINFTNDNSIDFISSLPKFENSKGETTDPRNSAILLNLEIFGVDSYIKNVSIPYDFDDVILLSPGKQKKFNITFFISELLDDFDAYVSIKKNNSEHQFLSSSLSSNMDSYHKYVSSIALDYYLEPGEYEI